MDVNNVKRKNRIGFEGSERKAHLPEGGRIFRQNLPNIVNQKNIKNQKKPDPDGQCEAPGSMIFNLLFGIHFSENQ